MNISFPSSNSNNIINFQRINYPSSRNIKIFLARSRSKQTSERKRERVKTNESIALPMELRNWGRSNITNNTPFLLLQFSLTLTMLAAPISPREEERILNFDSGNPCITPDPLTIITEIQFSSFPSAVRRHFG